jgi:hypothetical protein
VAGAAVPRRLRGFVVFAGSCCQDTDSRAPGAPAWPGHPGPRPGVQAAGGGAGRLARPNWPTAATRLDVRRPRPGARRRRIVARVLVGLLVLLALVAIWVAVGLLEARQDRLVRAAGVAGVVAGAPDLRG